MQFMHLKNAPFMLVIMEKCSRHSSEGISSAALFLSCAVKNNYMTGKNPNDLPSDGGVGLYESHKQCCKTEKVLPLPSFDRKSMIIRTW